jgi:glycerate kinase
VALADVGNPLVGREGAARIYGPQKGAGPEAVEVLDAALGRLAVVLEADLGLSVADLPGAGAAGGLGAGAVAFLGAELVPGAEWMIEQAGLRDLLRGADVLVTGEGRFDLQSSMGKLTGQVLDVARSVGLPVVLVCGEVEGRLPTGVVATDAGGRTVGEADVARMTEAACRSITNGDRL